MGVIALLSCGCTSTAGPYVTNIKAPGDGTLHVERCYVEFTTFLRGSVSTGECTSEKIPP